MTSKLLDQISQLERIDLVVMDWGIGGLSVYNEICKHSPELSILYFSDSGTTPYGKLPARKLRDRIQKIILSFHSAGIANFVIACNAASTALPKLQSEFKAQNIQVTGVIEHAIQLVRSTSYRQLGVIGGRRTILSQTYARALKTKSRRVKSRIAQPLSALIESGELNSEEMKFALQTILAPLRTCDSLLLACTHYPAVQDQIQSYLPQCKLLDPADKTARFVKTIWRLKTKQRQNIRPRQPLSHSQTSSPLRLFATTGDTTQMKTSARLAFSNRLRKANRLSI